MNPYYHRNLNLQPQYYYVSTTPLRFPPLYPMPVVYYPPVDYVDEVTIINSPTATPTWAPSHNPYVPYTQQYHPSTVEFERFLTESLILHNSSLQRRTPSGTRGSGLTEEVISKRLHVYTLQGNYVNCEMDSCSICLGEYEKNETIGRVECGHRFHSDCIKQWLKSKNQCPMCRSTALTV